MNITSLVSSSHPYVIETIKFHKFNTFFFFGQKECALISKVQRIICIVSKVQLALIWDGLEIA